MKQVFSRPRFWLVLGGLAAMLIILTVLSPAERTLGAAVRWVYLHVALTQAGLAWVVLTGLLGLGLLLPFTPLRRFDGWLLPASASGFALYIAGFIISGISQVTAWGGIAWQEPRVLAATNVMALWLAVLIAVALYPKRPLPEAAHAVLAGAVAWLTWSAENVLHPGNAIDTADSLAIPLFSLAMRLVAFTMGAWVVWNVARGTGDVITPTLQVDEISAQ